MHLSVSRDGQVRISNALIDNGYRAMNSFAFLAALIPGRALIWLSAGMVSSNLALADLSQKESLTYGMGIGVNRAGDFMNLEMGSGAHGSGSFGGLRQVQRFGGLLGFHNLYVHDRVSQNYFLGGYWENRVVPAEQEVVQAYSRLGLLAYSLNTQDFASSSGAGALLAFGVDSVLASSREDALFGIGASSVFVQVQGVFGLPRHKLFGEVLNGISIQVGLRNHF